MDRIVRSPHTSALAFAAALTGCAMANAQSPSPAPAPPAALPGPPPSVPLPTPTTVDAFQWLKGCWRGTVNQRAFIEQWLPAAGGMMIGAGHTVVQERTQDYEYLRLEARADGVYYVAVPSGQKEATFRLAGVTREEGSSAEIYTFDNLVEDFPQHIVYRRGSEGWLYAGIEGSLNGEVRKVIYPMRHVSCESGEVITK
jgi:hypothetical protein